MEKLIERFLRYVRFDTQSNSNIETCPSTAGQIRLAEQLKIELIELGLNASVDKNGYVMAKLPSNVAHNVPAIGFIAHMDTAPDASGKEVKPQIHENYQGGVIVLGESGQVLSPEQFPDMNNLIGQTLITTDGTTLLGGDNKAGIAEIMSAVAHLMANPAIPHGDICIGFTPDEEIGRGADRFNVEKFGAEWAYTIDGGPVGELEYENFNASAADIIVNGVSVHPGYAKNKLVNAQTLAAQFAARMPQDETPENTEGYEGFYHLAFMETNVAKVRLHYILRDFDEDGLAHRKAFLTDLVAQFNGELKAKGSKGNIELNIQDNYRNMKEMVLPHPQIMDIAKEAMIQADVQPEIKPIRGGTDGARLSFMGLPCPNVFTGGYNFHGIHEFVTVDGMKLAVKTIVNIAELTAKRYQ
jgi:tripeptide aminopeptidase